jgi:rhamnogalacturonan endolyase
MTIDPAKATAAREVRWPSRRANNGRIDIEVRYTHGTRASAGFTPTPQYTHPAANPTAGFGENRFILQSMNPTFDWLSVDQDRNQLMIADQDQRSGTVIHAKEQSIIRRRQLQELRRAQIHLLRHHVSASRLRFWSSTKDQIGVYFINPTTEYIGGGAEKMDLVCHMGGTLLDYWTSGHYAGGAGNSIPQGQDWTKVVGPIFVYLNALEIPKDPSPAELATLAATQGNPTVPRNLA